MNHSTAVRVDAVAASGATSSSRFVPVIVTVAPADPHVGRNEVIVGAQVPTPVVKVNVPALVAEPPLLLTVMVYSAPAVVIKRGRLRPQTMQPPSVCSWMRKECLAWWPGEA